MMITDILTGCIKKQHKLFYLQINTYPQDLENEIGDGKRRRKWIATGLPERGNKTQAEHILSIITTIIQKDGSLVPKYATSTRPVDKIAYDYPDLPEATLTSLKKYIGELPEINPDLKQAILSANQALTADGETHEEIREMLFCNYMVQWLERLEPTLAPVTAAGYRIYVHGRIFEYFSALGVTVANLKPGHIEDFYRFLHKEGLAANTVTKYHNNIRKSLHTLYKKQIIPNNPADLIDNRPERTGYDAKHYDEDEFNEYLAIVRDTKMELPVLLGGLYGLRRSEALGLKHSAINYKQGLITIQHTATQAKVNGTLQVIRADRTKNKSSKQSMPLLSQLIDAIERSKERQAHYQKKLGKLYCVKDKDYLCLDEYGRLLKPNYVSYRHKEILDYHGLRHIRYHDLRHSAATILIAHGVPLEYIQKFMRHATIDMTQRYAHLNVNKVMEETAFVISNLIKNEKKSEKSPMKNLMSNIFSADSPVFLIRCADDKIYSKLNRLQKQRKPLIERLSSMRLKGLEPSPD